MIAVFKLKLPLSVTYLKSLSIQRHRGFGLHRHGVQQDYRSDCPLVCSTAETEPRILCSVWAPHYKEDIELFQCMQRRVVKLVKGLESKT